MNKPYDQRRPIKERFDDEFTLLESLFAYALCAMWIAAGVLMPIPTLILWQLNKRGIASPNPITYYLFWAAVQAIPALLVAYNSG